jgi:hypothetical protein
MFRKLRRLMKAEKYPFYKCYDIEGKQVEVYLNRIDL